MSEHFQLPEKIQGARILLAHTRPYLSALLWAMIPVARTKESGLMTMAVDRYGRWYINVEEVEKWTIPHIALGILHECNHLLRRHHDRMQMFEDWITPDGTSLANWGGDLEINDGLKEEADAFGTVLPKDWLCPATFGFADGLLAEEYCDKLLKKAQKDGRCFHMTHPGQGGQKNKNSGGSGEGDSKGNSGQNKAGGGVGTGRCGSCSGTSKESWEDDAPKGTDNGTSSTPGLTSSEIDILRRHVAQSVKEHNASRGTVPAGWKRWAEAELAPPKVPWTKELAAVVRRAHADAAGMVDYSWKRISRRSTKQILLPGLRQPKVEAIGVIDTSGSMGEGDLSAALREFAGVMKVVGLEGMRYLSVDAAASAVKRVFKASQVDLVGGGGTDMRVGIEAALKSKPLPNYIIVFTDGYTPWPDEAPKNTKIIAVLTQEKSPKPPNWIRALYVN